MLEKNKKANKKRQLMREERREKRVNFKKKINK